LKTKVSLENTSNVFRSHYTGKNATITGHFGFLFEENEVGGRKPHDYRDKSDYIIPKYSFQNVFRAEEKEKPALLNSSSLKGDFENLHFRE